MDKDSSIDLNYEQPYLRAKVASYEREVANLKEDNINLTASLYDAYARIKLLNEQLEDILKDREPNTISGDERTW